MLKQLASPNLAWWKQVKSKVCGFLLLPGPSDVIVNETGYTDYTDGENYRETYLKCLV